MRTGRISERRLRGQGHAGFLVMCQPLQIDDAGGMSAAPPIAAEAMPRPPSWWPRFGLSSDTVQGTVAEATGHVRRHSIVYCCARGGIEDKGLGLCRMAIVADLPHSSTIS
jgi:hypothetical protein